jgi:hypothetical protein
MGLDNQICYGIDDERDLSEETIQMIYSNVHELEYLGMSLTLEEALKNKYIFICGKIYYGIINKLTEFNLYNNLGPTELYKMYEKLNKYIKDNEEQLDKIESLLNENYENAQAIEMYVETFSSDKVYFLYPSNIKTLCQLFKVMSDNNLWLVASY